MEDHSLSNAPVNSERAQSNFPVNPYRDHGVISTGYPQVLEEPCRTSEGTGRSRGKGLPAPRPFRTNASRPQSPAASSSATATIPRVPRDVQQYERTQSTRSIDMPEPSFSLPHYHITSCHFTFLSTPLSRPHHHPSGAKDTETIVGLITCLSTLEAQQKQVSCDCWDDDLPFRTVLLTYTNKPR